MKPMRLVALVALVAMLSLLTLNAAGQNPGFDPKKLEEILKQKGVPPEQIAKIQEMLKQKGITPEQLEKFKQFQGKGGFGGFGGKPGLPDGKGQRGKPGLPDGKGQPGSSFTDPLVSADTLAKIKLSPTQKTAYDKLAREFDTKNKELTAKLPAAAPGQDFRAKFQADIQARFNKGGGGAAPPSPEVMAILTLREDCEKKFEALLTDPQKKTLDEIRAKANEALLLGGK